MLTPESTLEAMILRQVAEVKRAYPGWSDPEAFAEDLKIRVIRTSLGSRQEGAALDDAIVIDPAFGTLARQRFTWYHELTHQLLRRNDELYAILHDQYPNEEDFIRIRERLCNIGAAEFLIPREEVRALVGEHGYSIRCVQALSTSTGASRTAICVQLVRCALHRCVGVVCHWHTPNSPHGPTLLTSPLAQPVLRVAVGITSPSMRYPVSRGNIIPTGHLLYGLKGAMEGVVYEGRGAIPFREIRHEWVVPCEAIRLGEQVFAIFHVDPRPIHLEEQLTLF